MKRNLVSISCLVRNRCTFFIDFSRIKISRDSLYLGSGSFVNDYWLLDCSFPEEILLIEDTQTDLSLKRKHSENSTYLWHRRLAHISKERLQRLVKENLLPALDFSDLVNCIECLKGKLTKTRNKDSQRSTEPLYLIHTDFCGPFANKTICGNKYFITFIDDYTRYCQVFLLTEKSQALEKFKVFRTEAKKRTRKRD